MLVHITNFYAAILAFIWFALFANVGRLRSKLKINVGDDGNPEMYIANRQYMNFVECVPLALLLLYMVEDNGGSARLVHALGAILVIARILHPFGMRIDRMNTLCRMIGAGGTVIVIAVCGATLMHQYFLG